MRKIDAVLLSALIIYDYSAQSLVDSDTISFGRSFTNNSVSESKLANQDYTFTPNFTDLDSFTRGAQKISQGNTNEAVDNKTISFYELAKVNPATAAIASENTDAEADAVSINIPVPAEADIEAPEAFSTATASVDVNTANYSNELTDTEMINEQVATVADMSTVDTDNDGTYDVEDKCPGVTGVARFEGCPVPDSDGDGVNDEEDRCPFEVGSADNYGCPVTISETTAVETSDETVTATEVSAGKTEAAASANDKFSFVISFNKDNKILSSEDFNIVLQLTDILTRIPDAKVEIENTANANTTLPQTPVELLANYFKDLGVSENQIIIAKQAKEIKEISKDGNSKVEMRIKL